MLLLAASLRDERWYQWAGVALLAVACAPWRRFPAKGLGAVLGLYCGWLLADALFVSPVYSAESLYQPLLLLGAFAAFAGLARERRQELFGVGVVLVCGLVLLGLLQHLFGIWQLPVGIWHLAANPTRAAAIFVTPNSFATAVDMFLLPLAALYAVRGSRRCLALSLWLFAGLIASESRGGLLAFLAGLAYLALCLGLPVLKSRSGRLARLGAGFIAVAAAVEYAGPLLSLVSPSGAGFGEPAIIAAWHERGAAERPELYAATLGFIRERPLAGYGANMFYPLFESVKPDSLRGLEYFYAHNDYLQIWLEFGLPGIALLLALAGGALIVARRAHLRGGGGEVPLVCGAALAPCFAHAMVDFPLYIPFILMLVGAYLGALAAHLDGPSPGPVPGIVARALEPITPPVRWALVLAALAWLSQPMLAEFAVYRSIALLARGDTRGGLYWQSVARRLEPRHPWHYWAEGTIWRAQAEFTGNKRLAAQADAMYAQGARADPYDAANLLARADLQRRRPDLFAHPAPARQVLAWAERAAALKPQSLAVQVDLAFALVYAGEPERARALAGRLRREFPNSPLARRLQAAL